MRRIKCPAMKIKDEIIRQQAERIKELEAVVENFEFI